MNRHRNYSFIVVMLLALNVLPTIAANWPTWLGERMDSTWRETGINENFATQHPTILWRVPADLGYASPAVADGKVYLFDYVRESGEVTNAPTGKDKLTGQERVRCMNAETGEIIWSYAYDQSYFLSYPSGPRCMPSVADGRVYTLGAEGKLSCLSVEKGGLLWQKDFKEMYGAETPLWGHAAHPLLYGRLVICVVGGEGSVAVAFDKNTGEEKWRALSAAEPGYCPPSIIEHAGVKQLLIWHGEALNALSPLTGDVLWSLGLKPSFGMAIMPPRKVGDVLFASGIGKIGALIQLGSPTTDPKFVWKSTPKTGVYCANSTPFILGDTIYGCDIDTSSFMAVDLSSAERLWSSTKPTLAADAPAGARHGTAFITYHEPSGRFFLFSETGDLIIAEPSRQAYKEISRWHALDPSNTAFGRPVVWSAPAYAMKSAFIRNDKELIRVDLSGN